MTLKGAVSVVTGAGRGIGSAIARALAAEGSKVVLTSRTERELAEVKKLIEQSGGTASVFVCDVTDESSIARLFEFIRKEYGSLDVLVNNAGIGLFKQVRDMTADEFDALWKVNVRGLFLCSRYALGLMEPQKNGTIVNVSSLAGKNFFENGSAYIATKWAVNGFSKSMMLEVRSSNVRVIVVCPGTVDTSFSTPSHASERVPKMLQASDVADAVIAACRLPERAMISEIEIRPTNPK